MMDSDLPRDIRYESIVDMRYIAGLNNVGKLLVYIEDSSLHAVMQNIQKSYPDAWVKMVSGWEVRIVEHQLRFYVRARIEDPDLVQDLLHQVTALRTWMHELIDQVGR